LWFYTSWSPSHAPTMKKLRARSLLLAAAVLTAFLLVEVVLTAFHELAPGQASRHQLQSLRRQMLFDLMGAARPDSDRAFENRLVIHPLFGFTYNPNDEGVNNFGFRTGQDVWLGDSGYEIRGHSRGDFAVVGVFGGSFAEIIGGEHQYFESRLQGLFGSRKPLVMSFAVGGHALPQAAFIYLYFREMFDIIVFIDGLNELWNYVENNEAGWPPEYAKAWHFRYMLSRDELTPDNFEHTSTIVALKQRLRSMTELSLKPVLRSSLVVHRVWDALQMRWSRVIAEESLAIKSDYREGEKFFDQDDDRLLAHAARQWGRYHRLIDEVATSQGSLAIHLLQPNPFVPGSKALTREEVAKVRSSFPVEDYVLKGYPRLRREVSALKHHGLIARDLSYVFRKVRTPIWVDSAHVNRDGARQIIDRIASLIEDNRNAEARETPLQGE
jgi:hypothetical protein